ncbi:MAG TPA: DUF2207 domain-containing protein [Coriobacteriia bacterium]|jgi:uncharacterized membrane protein YgcG
MRIRRLAWVAIAALAFLLAVVPPAFAKDYHVASIDIAAVVRPDGSMTVTEERQVAFNGDFHWAQWALDKKGSQGIELTGIDGPNGPMRLAGTDIAAVPAPGTYSVSDEPGRLLIKVGFAASDQTLGFTLRYKVLGAATRWTDTSESYWKFVGDQTDVRTDRVHVRVVLPPSVTLQEVKAWAHGPLNGVVAIGTEARKGEPNATYVTLDVTDLPPRTFVEGRILFPASALAQAPVVDQPRAALVQREEGALAEQANARRVKARAAVALAVFAGIGVPLLVLGVVVLLWSRYGREYVATEVQGEYYRDIPEGISAPLVGALWRMGQPDDATLGATLMDLSIQGAVYMKPVTLQEPGLLGLGSHQEPTYELTLERAKLAEADELERDLATFVFDETMRLDTFTLHDLKEHAKAHPQAFTSGLAAWKSQVAGKADALGWIEPQSRNWEYVSMGLASLAGFSAFFTAVGTQSALPAVGLVPAVAAFVLAFQVKRRSREAVELFAKYEGLRNYLRDFSRMQEKVPAEVALWERYLVLAVIFGIADQVIAQMRVAAPDVVNDPAFATAYWWASPTAYGDHSSPVGSITSGFAAAVSAANSAMSSSSGGGGGFSGGGGGGGGGGGFSAG